MDILILGGTQYLGRHIVEAALDRGHDVTLFNRQKTNPGLFKEIRSIQGDRNCIEDLMKLSNLKWDVIIDTCGDTPTSVRRSAELLRDSAGQYVFISSSAVYQELFTKNNINEENPINISDEVKEMLLCDNFEYEPLFYGPLKYLSELEVIHQYRSKALIIRPHVIVGPYDFNDLFLYWIKKISSSNRVLGPDNKDQVLQLLDVRDLAMWIVLLGENQSTGIYNASGPKEKMTMEMFLNACKSELNTSNEIIWTSRQFLASHNVNSWTDLPFWIPTKTEFGLDSSKAFENGLSPRPLNETIKDTYDWARKNKIKVTNSGLSKIKEMELLRKWELEISRK